MGLLLSEEIMSEGRRERENPANDRKRRRRRSRRRRMIKTVRTRASVQFSSLPKLTRKLASLMQLLHFL